MMDYYSKLVCPICKTPPEVSIERLKCQRCRAEFPIIDGIPIFIDTAEQRRWNNYHIKEYTPLLLNPDRRSFTYDVPLKEECYLSAPLTEDDYYKRYVDNWRVMLDLGCGDGVFSASLSDKVEEIYCVDPSFIALKRLLKRGKRNMYPINAEGSRLPFPDNFFDGVFFIFVVEHVTNPLPILDEIRRVLKPTGHLILSTDSKFYYRYFRPIIEFLKYRRYRPDDPTHVNLMTPKQVRELLKKTNFISELEDLHYFIPKKLLRFIPRQISEPFLASLIIHKCKPIK